MQSHPPPSSRRIDEDWLQQWIAFGMLDMAIYLARHAKFAAYLATERPRVEGILKGLGLVG